MLAICMFWLFLAFLVAVPHVVGLAVAIFVAGVSLGYFFRNAIAKDISALKLSSMITKLEATGAEDLSSLKRIASEVAADLRKSL
jgi:hypothetical protein